MKTAITLSTGKVIELIDEELNELRASSILYWPVYLPYQPIPTFPEWPRYPNYPIVTYNTSVNK